MAISDATVKKTACLRNARLPMSIGPYGSEWIDHTPARATA